MVSPIQEHFDRFGYVLLAAGEAPTKAVTTFPAQWEAAYFSNRFHEIDPVFDFANTHTRSSGAELLTDCQMQGSLFEEARMFGADSNFVCVSHYAGHRLVFGGVNHDLDDRKILECKSSIQKTHRADLAKKVSLLSDTQIDFLEMSEEGMLDKEIAAELNITLSAVAQRKRVICKLFGIDSFRSGVQLYSLVKWGGIVPEHSL